MHSNAAFFIGPEELIVPVYINHITTVFMNPEIFSYSRDAVTEIYRKHNETLGLEAKARKEILTALIEKRWIRLRRYPNDCWAITLWQLNDTEQNHLSVFFCKILEGYLGFKETDLYLPVKITQFSDGITIQGLTVEDIAKGSFTNSQQSQGAPELDAI